MRRSTTIMMLVAVALVAGALGLQRVEQRLVSPNTSDVETASVQELGDAPKPRYDGELITHLPIISIDTHGEPIPWVNHDGEPMDGLPAGLNVTPACDIDIRDAEGSWHRQSDDPDLTVQGTIRIRGNSSRNFDKKSYLLNIVDAMGEDANEALLGMPAGTEWVLHGPFLDRSLMRNYLCYAIAREVMPYAPRTRYCEVILNGEYEGVYLLTEAITREEGRINISEPARNSEITGWLVRWDREGKGDTPLDVFSHYTLRSGVSGLDLRYPGRSNSTQERIDYTLSEISGIERELYADGNSNSVDVAAFAQYFVLNEFFGNVDAGRFSTFYYRDVRGKVTPVVWDFNNACDNYIEYVYDDSGFYMVEAPWFSAMITDELFVETAIAQYRTLRKSLLSDEYLCSLIDDTAVYLGDAVDRNYERWEVFDLTSIDPLTSASYDVNYLHPLERNYASYDEAVEQLKDWLVDRGAWLDEHIDSLRQYCHPSRNA